MAKKKRKLKTNEIEGYCVKCKDHQHIEGAERVKMKNGRFAMKGKCPDCGTGMFRILGAGQ